MRRVNTKKSWIALAFLIGTGAVISAEAASEGPPQGLLEEIKLFSKAIGAIDQAFVGDVTPRSLLYGAVKGMLEGLNDRYTEFIDPKRFSLLQIQLKGEYAGIGAMLEIIDNYPAVRSLRPGSAAMKSGLKPGDRIVRINQVTTEGLALTEIAPQLRGEAGTALILTIMRPSTGQTFDLEIIRETIELEAVKDVRMIGKRTGYLWLQDWQEKTLTQVDHAIESLREQGMKALILDLRNNDGGLLPMAVGLCEKFLAEGEMIVRVESKLVEQRKDYVSEGEHTYSDLKLVVLVNEKSASASEVFSAAMQDHKRAVLVGTKTFGKASVQSLVPLDESSGMKLTTARYKSPEGREIDQVGLMPDFVVENQAAGQGPDRQVLKAIELFRDYM